jgi:hypothetical protein
MPEKRDFVWVWKDGRLALRPFVQPQPHPLPSQLLAVGQQCLDERGFNSRIG